MKMAMDSRQNVHSPTAQSRTLEKLFEEAQYTGVIDLSNRKLKEYPKSKKEYDLTDTSTADLSRNRLLDIPEEVCQFPNLERLNVYNNVIRALPQAIVQLQSLVHLNISRNQLAVLPECISQLRALEVLIASNNRLVSLVEAIGELEHLMHIDLSCNELSHLPAMVGNLKSLRNLNVRRNQLVELPRELSKTGLQTLDISFNRLRELPLELRHLDTLETLNLDNNPFEMPPAHVCTRGRVHVIKYLQNKAIQEDRKKGILQDMELQHTMRPTSLSPALCDELRHLEASDALRKRLTVDSGYSTTDSGRLSPNQWLGEAIGSGVVIQQELFFNQPSSTYLARILGKQYRMAVQEHFAASRPCDLSISSHYSNVNIEERRLANQNRAACISLHRRYNSSQLLTTQTDEQCVTTATTNPLLSATVTYSYAPSSPATLPRRRTNQQSAMISPASATYLAPDWTDCALSRSHSSTPTTPTRANPYFPPSHTHNSELNDSSSISVEVLRTPSEQRDLPSPQTPPTPRFKLDQRQKRFTLPSTNSSSYVGKSNAANGEENNSSDGICIEKEEDKSNSSKIPIASVSKNVSIVSSTSSQLNSPIEAYKTLPEPPEVYNAPTTSLPVSHTTVQETHAPRISECHHRLFIEPNFKTSASIHFTPVKSRARSAGIETSRGNYATKEEKVESVNSIGCSANEDVNQSVRPASLKENSVQKGSTLKSHLPTVQMLTTVLSSAVHVANKSFASVNPGTTLADQSIQSRKTQKQSDPPIGQVNQSTNVSHSDCPASSKSTNVSHSDCPASSISSNVNHSDCSASLAKRSKSATSMIVLPSPCPSPLVQRSSARNSLSQVDEFTRELEKQRSEYEARKQRAEQTRLEREKLAQSKDPESESRRRTALRLQEQQQQQQGAVIAPTVVSGATGYAVTSNGHTENHEEYSSQRRLSQSNSFKEDRSPGYSAPPQYQRAFSEAGQGTPGAPGTPGSDRYPGHIPSSIHQQQIVSNMSPSVNSGQDFPKNNFSDQVQGQYQGQGHTQGHSQSQGHMQGHNPTYGHNFNRTVPHPQQDSHQNMSYMHGHPQGKGQLQGQHESQGHLQGQGYTMQNNSDVYGSFNTNPPQHITMDQAAILNDYSPESPAIHRRTNGGLDHPDSASLSPQQQYPVSSIPSHQQYPSSTVQYSTNSYSQHPIYATPITQPATMSSVSHNEIYSTTSEIYSTTGHNWSAPDQGQVPSNHNKALPIATQSPSATQNWTPTSPVVSPGSKTNGPVSSPQHRTGSRSASHLKSPSSDKRGFSSASSDKGGYTSSLSSIPTPSRDRKTAVTSPISEKRGYAGPDRRGFATVDKRGYSGSSPASDKGGYSSQVDRRGGHTPTEKRGHTPTHSDKRSYATIGPGSYTSPMTDRRVTGSGTTIGRTQHATRRANSSLDESWSSDASDSSELRHRRDRLTQQQRHQTGVARRRVEEEKQRLKQHQKQAVQAYVTQQRGHTPTGERRTSESGSQFSRDSTPNTSFESSSSAAATGTTAANHSQAADVGIPRYQAAMEKLERMSTELNSNAPGFTVRRQLDEISRDHQQSDTLSEIIESRLKVRLPGDLAAALRDGVVLCHLANHVQPRSVSSIHVPSHQMPKLSVPKCRRNVESFLEACRRLGVKEEYCCPASVVLEETGLNQLTVTVQALIECSANPQHSQV